MTGDQIVDRLLAGVQAEFVEQTFKSCVGESIFISLRVASSGDLRCGFITSEGAALQEFVSDVQKQE